MEEIQSQISDLRQQWDELRSKINLSQKKDQIKELEVTSSDPALWQDQDRARKVMSELSGLQGEVKEVEDITTRLQNLSEVSTVADQGLKTDLETELSAITQQIEKFETKLFLSGPYDPGSAILSIHAGQGGTEAMDWAEMLLRMYLRYCERQGWKTSIIDESRGEEAGIKSVTLEVDGRFAYGYLKNEAGTHRLVRQSPFNADHLRQTSFALVEVLPVIEDQTEVVIKPEDIRMDTFRSSGAGGQNVQKVNSAVRLTHIPTGLTASVQTERSQLQNREYAMRILRAKLWELEEAKRRGEIQALKGDYRPASWGTQIRSYVLHPYQLVKDLRTGYETADTGATLNGEIDRFIEEALRR